MTTTSHYEIPMQHLAEVLSPPCNGDRYTVSVEEDGDLTDIHHTEFYCPRHGRTERQS